MAGAQVGFNLVVFVIQAQLIKLSMQLDSREASLRMEEESIAARYGADTFIIEWSRLRLSGAVSGEAAVD